MTDSAEAHVHGPVYKILTGDEQRQLEDTGGFDGNADDLRDGFVHLVFAEQVRSVVNKRFGGQVGLVIAELGPAVVDEIRVEPARSGVLYPHLFRALQLADLRRAIPLEQFLDGGT